MLDSQKMRVIAAAGTALLTVMGVDTQVRAQTGETVPPGISDTKQRGADISEKQKEYQDKQAVLEASDEYRSLLKEYHEYTTAMASKISKGEVYRKRLEYGEETNVTADDKAEALRRGVERGEFPRRFIELNRKFGIDHGYDSEIRRLEGVYERGLMSELDRLEFYGYTCTRFENKPNYCVLS